MRQSPRWRSRWWRHLSMSDNIWSSRGEIFLPPSWRTSRACALRVCSPPAAIAVTQAISQTLICKAFKVQVQSSKWFIQSKIITGGTNHKSTREKQLKKYINIIRQFITWYSQTQVQTNTIDGLLPCQQIGVYRGPSARPQQLHC